MITHYHLNTVGPLQTSQRAWDAPMVVRDCQTLLDNATSDINKTRLPAVKADHGSEWIFALPISACGLRISNEAVRIAFDIRLGLNFCEPHSCPCGGVVDAKGIHGLSCKRSACRSICRQQTHLKKTSFICFFHLRRLRKLRLVFD